MKINELSRLYDITAHSLRYYEKIGLIIPERDTNNYRVYTQEHLEKLNIIRDLRGFNLSLLEIKDYLENKTLAKTVKLLDNGIKSVKQQQQELQDKHDFLKDRLITINESQKNIIGKIFSIEYPERAIIAGNNKNIKLHQIDYELKYLHKSYEDILKFSNQNIFGSFIKLKDNKISYQVFYYNKYCTNLENISFKTLPAGKYLCICYRGDYTQVYNFIHTIEDYINTNGLIKIGDYLELYLIDFHETNLPEEFITQLEVRVNTKQ